MQNCEISETITAEIRDRYPRAKLEVVDLVTANDRDVNARD